MVQDSGLRSQELDTNMCRVMRDHRRSAASLKISPMRIYADAPWELPSSLIISPHATWISKNNTIFTNKKRKPALFLKGAVVAGIYEVIKRPETQPLVCIKESHTAAKSNRLTRCWLGLRYPDYGAGVFVVRCADL